MIYMLADTVNRVVGYIGITSDYHRRKFQHMETYQRASLYAQYNCVMSSKLNWFAYLKQSNICIEMIEIPPCYELASHLNPNGNLLDRQSEEFYINDFRTNGLRLTNHIHNTCDHIATCQYPNCEYCKFIGVQS